MAKQQTKRGRPPKIFIPRKPTIKRERVGRPRKEEVRYEGDEQKTPLSIRNKNISYEEWRKDAIIFALFLVSFGVFCLAIYMGYSKNTSNSQQTQDSSSQEVRQESGTSPIKELQAIIQQETPTSKNYSLIEQFYQGLFTNERNTYISMVEDKLRQGEIFRRYFTTERIRKFKQLQKDTPHITIISQETGTNETQIIRFQITYTLTTNEQFTEERTATISNRNNQQKIAKLMCETPGCSKMPFFNPGRYTK